MRSKATRVLAALMLCTLVQAPAALAQGGVNLGWDNCPDEGGTSNRNFSCGTNSGNNVAVASFVLPVDAPRVVGIYAEVDILGAAQPGSPLEPIPAWWNLQSGGCRAGSLTYSTDFTGAPFDAATQCFDVWENQAFGGLDYKVGVGGDPGHARFKMIAAVPGNQSKSLVAGREYYGFRIGVDNAKSDGAGSCDGCSTPVSLVLSLVQIAQPLGVGDFNLTTPIQQNTVTWQRTRQQDVTPAARRSWGQIKSLYR